MTDADRLAEKAGWVLDNEAFQLVLADIETAALDELLHANSIWPKRRDVKRQAVIDRVNAVREIKKRLEILQFQAKHAARPRPAVA